MSSVNAVLSQSVRYFDCHFAESAVNLGSHGKDRRHSKEMVWNGPRNFCVLWRRYDAPRKQDEKMNEIGVEGNLFKAGPQFSCGRCALQMLEAVWGRGAPVGTFS